MPHVPAMMLYLQFPISTKLLSHMIMSIREYYDPIHRVIPELKEYDFQTCTVEPRNMSQSVTHLYGAS